MELELQFSENDLIVFLYHFTLCLCLLFIYLDICYFILFTSRHIPLHLVRKCISNHANIWDGSSLRNKQRSLAADCFCRELHLECLHWLKSKKLLPFGLSYHFIDN